MEDIKTIAITDPFGFIYLTTNMINGKKYIGQKKFKRGWKIYIGSGKILKDAIKKYGKESFVREIIAIAFSREELDKLEIEFIKNHNAVESEDYYNLSYGGKVGINNFGRHPTEATKRKLSLLNKGENNPNYGTHFSKERKQQISESHKGEKNPYFGKKHSEEIRMKISQSNLGKKRTAEFRKLTSERQIKFTESEVNEIREKYATGKYFQKDLAKEYSVSKSLIGCVVGFRGAYKK